MRVDVRAEVVIARAREAVAAYVADPANAAEWCANVVDVEWRTRPPLREGSRLGFLTRFLGRTARYTYQVAELVPGERLVLRAARPFRQEIACTCASVSPCRTGRTLHHRADPKFGGRVPRRQHPAREPAGPAAAAERPGNQAPLMRP
ncbi:SRPBCC family protein [Amycolatopsis viridis]|uniref:Uncharacterized protein YndB with AHSA1/START domain n=1 Tax=Amycolatopsis viridis TaxID=185678 RepID=A0ABX0SPC8_9PSEU|nr:SRPBCC family protein [Amycolatopsis viridis]NIH78814.1 uncharacterized protein YndB with AHSA1/START domain [Amycolatopsis viridis]